MLHGGLGLVGESFLQGGPECAGSADMSDSLQLIDEMVSVLLERACCSPCSQQG